MNVKGQLVGYIRVSTLEQNTDRQVEQLKQYSLDELFTDYASGKDTARPQLHAALKHLRKGDCLIVTSMDRLARNLDDLRKLVRELTSKSIKITFIKENLTFGEDDSPLLSVMGAFAEFERSLIRERQREGILIAKNKGIYKGRKKSLNDSQIKLLKEKDAINNFKNRALLAKEFGITRPTLYKYIL
jgi:DNA invertase Pin-like site-specific DNA recombinase